MGIRNLQNQAYDPISVVVDKPRVRLISAHNKQLSFDLLTGEDIPKPI